MRLNDGESIPIHDWYARFRIEDGATCDRPGIYQWEINGDPGKVYIGKFTSIGRPTRAYAVNVERLIGKRAYRKGKPKQFRRIHHELADAVRRKAAIVLSILENPPYDELNRRERALITERGTLNKGHPAYQPPPKT